MSRDCPAGCTWLTLLATARPSDFLSPMKERGHDRGSAFQSQAAQVGEGLGVTRPTAHRAVEPGRVAVSAAQGGACGARDLRPVPPAETGPKGRMRARVARPDGA